MNIAIHQDERALLDNLAELQTLIGELRDLARQKLKAVRAADGVALRQLAQREEQTLPAVEQSHRDRDAILARLAQALRNPELRVMPLQRLANELAEPVRSSLLSRALALRTAGEELQRVNGVVAAVAHGLHAHVQGVFDAVARFMQKAIVYGPQGRHEAQQHRVMVDAIG